MEDDDATFSDMDELFSYAGDNNFSELGKQICRMGLYLKANNCPAHLQPQEEFVLGEELVVSCPYPMCFNGQVCLLHVQICEERGCRLCKSMFELVKFHSGQCTAPNCIIPRCSELKQRRLRKEMKLRKREERITRLREKESELKRIYNLPMLELQRAAAAAEDGRS